MPPIVKIKNVSKQYRLGRSEAPYATLRETLTGAVRAPLARLRRNGRIADESLWALNDVSLDVMPGEVVGIIGRNGAGKSTLLKVLSRITEPTTGRIELFGRVASLLEVGTGFHPELTGRENISLNGAILGMRRSEIERKFDEIIAFAELDKFLDTPVKRYSSGMYMRLAFSVAAHLQPEILVIDEVLAVGDAQFQKKCLGKMGEVAKAGRTVLFVSHNMDAVRKLCSRAVLLEHGRVSTSGETEAVIKTYLEGGADVQSVYTIRPPRQEENPPGYAYRLVVEDKDGHLASSIPAGQPWQIRIHFKITRRTEHFIIAIGLRTSMDVAVRTSWSNPQTIEPGEYQAVFREETVLLGSGLYPIVVGLSTHERSFQYVENVGTLEIAEFSEGIDLVRVSNVGFIINPLDIKIHKIL